MYPCTVLHLLALTVVHTCIPCNQGWLVTRVFPHNCSMELEVDPHVIVIASDPRTGAKKGGNSTRTCDDSAPTSQQHHWKTTILKSSLLDSIFINRPVKTWECQTPGNQRQTRQLIEDGVAIAANTTHLQIRSAFNSRDNLQGNRFNRLSEPFDLGHRQNTPGLS